MRNRLGGAAAATAAVTAAAALLLPAVGGAATAHPLRTSLRVDFGTRSAAPAHGYAADYGLAYTSARGYGWTKVAGGRPVSLVGNGVRRATPKDPRYRTFLQMQAAHGPVKTQAQWQVALYNGLYDVTVAVGDAGGTDSVDRITAQPHAASQVVLVGGFTPTSAHRFFTVTKRVRVTSNRLTLSPAGGRNTKIDFVVVVPVKDKIRPTVSAALGGPGSGPGLYTGPVRVTVTARDNPGGSGIKTVTYQLDGGPAVPYTGPVVVSSVGEHTLVARASDLVGNVGSRTISWTEAPPGQTTPPPVTSPTTTAPHTSAPPGGSSGDLTQGGTVSPSCQVTSFDGVLPNTAGDQCLPGNISFVPGAGLQLTSAAGQLANDNQQNALYQTFDASSGTFTLTARVVGPVNQLTQNYQQIGAWFGPDQNNFVKVEAEHNGAGAPHLTMFPRNGGVVGTVASIPLPALTSATTLDLVIKAASNQVTVFYRLNGGPLVQVGAGFTPTAVGSWFSSTSKAGILTSNSGTTSTITATFSSFVITPG